MLPPHKMSLAFWGAVLSVTKATTEKHRPGSRLLARKSQPAFSMSNKAEQAQLFSTALLWWHFPLFSASLGETWICGSN